ncbi:uncharacterized protein LOC143912431 [Arctopsyche grandis]|uniref:uncharacterized protein LOC143912431 n=1 Tax=Arctopsyche grandis TaxID=121162 RepID=UPI00406D99CA
MREHSEPFYYNQQIFIPPNFPHLLKVYAKAAIRTQPYDLLTWSASYFRALADGKLPPIKTRLEYPILRSRGGLSPGYLKLLIQQFSGSTEVEKLLLEKTWTGICLNDNELKQILCLAGVYKESNFALYKFVAVAAGFLAKSLTQTMIMLCELFTIEPDGGSAAISSDLFVDLYTFLTAIDASKQNKFIDGYLEGTTNAESQIEAIKNDKNSESVPKTDDVESVEKKSFSIADIQEDIIETSDDTVIFDDLKEFVDRKDLSSSQNESEEVVESSDNNPITSTDTDDAHASTQSETESTQSGSPKKSMRSSVKFHEITEQESMSFDDGYKYSQDEFETSDSPTGEVPSPQRQSNDGEEMITEKKDVSIEERQAIIDELQRNKDEKIKNMEEIMNSIDDLAEKSQSSIEKKSSTASDEFIENERNSTEQPKKSISVEDKVDVNPNARGVVNPIFKGLFDNVVDKMCVVNAFKERELETIVVPPIPGIGPIVDDAVVDEFLKYVRETAADQCDMFMPRDIRHYFCPPLEKI